MYLPHLRHGVWAVLDFVLFGKLVRPIYALCGFCSSGQDFASSFLQIPPRDGHLCFQLTVPTAKPVTDLHRQVIVHAGHTDTPRSRDCGVSTLTHCSTLKATQQSCQGIKPKEIKSHGTSTTEWRKT
jgi:hypothetical protein